MTLLQAEDLNAIMPRLDLGRARQLVAPLDRTLVEFEIVSRRRVAAFLAQTAHESGELLRFEETASGNQYDPRVNPRVAKILGNTQPGDGPRYKGRGPLQLTGRWNYRTAGRALGLELERNPTLVATADVGFRAAGWYWEFRGLNAYADQSDFWNLTYRINAARSHYSRRRTYYERALEALPRSLS